MIDPKKFLEDFTKDIVKHPGNRPELIAGYAAHMQAREDAIRKEAELKATLSAFQLIDSKHDELQVKYGSRLHGDIDVLIDLMRFVYIMTTELEAAHANPTTPQA